jgi:NAD(P)-dependent dehydrogenase (short-subunit alcohol dehydrogenase family)
MKTTLVTGGSGYFGSLLVQKLLERGYHVRIFDLCKPDSIGDILEFQQGDIRDTSAVSTACRDMEYVFHNVAQVPLAKDSKLFWSVNRDGTRNLLDACLAHHVRKVVYTSSSAIYGVPKTNPVTEKTEPLPGEDYGRASLPAKNFAVNPRRKAWTFPSSAQEPSSDMAAWASFKFFLNGFIRAKISLCSTTEKISINSSMRMISPRPAYLQVKSRVRKIITAAQIPSEPYARLLKTSAAMRAPARD